MRRRHGRIPRIALLLLFTAPFRNAFAVDQPGLRVCHGVVAPGRVDADIRLMRVRSGARRVNFLRDRTEKTPLCPSRLDRCRLPSSVSPNDLLLASPEMEDHVCAMHVATARRRQAVSIGFVPLSALVEIPADKPSSESWRGVWRNRAALTEVRIDIDGLDAIRIHGVFRRAILPP